MKKETKNIVSRTAKAIADSSSKNEEAKEKYTNAIAASEKMILSAEDKMLSAMGIDDAKAYHAAKSEKESAEAEREMFQRKLAQIESNGILSDSEAKEILASLKAAEEDEFLFLSKEVKAMAMRITELKHSYDEALKELNDLNFSLPEIKPGVKYEPLGIRMANPVLSFAVYAERFLSNT